MRISRLRLFCLTAGPVVFFILSGCGKPATREFVTEADLGSTIGSLAEVRALELIPVEGYGVVHRLDNTGSSECPSHIRSYLKQYVLAKLPSGEVDVDKFINRPDTAVVRVRGLMPAAVRKNEVFDVRVDALAGTQTTSLRGGWLLAAELKRTGQFGLTTRILASADGPVFIDTIDASGSDERFGYVLAGGRVRDEYKMAIELRRPDYLVSRRISDLLNGRFGDGTARAVSPGIIELQVAPGYAEQKQRFILAVKSMYLAQTPEVVEKRVSAFVAKLASSADKDESEATLEAMGNASLKKLSVLLNSADQELRLRAARCMLNIGSSHGLETLRSIAEDTGSGHRVEALEAIAAGANRRDAATTARRLLRDEDFKVRLAAYEQLRRLDDIAVTRTPVGGNFYLEQIAVGGEKEIFVSRSGQPRIVLFGAPIYCRDSVFVQSADGTITINSPGGRGYISLIRKVPGRTGVVELKSSSELSDIIRRLCEEPMGKPGVRLGLGVTYAEAIALLKQMCEKRAVEAQFRAGPLPSLGEGLVSPAQPAETTGG